MRITEMRMSEYIGPLAARERASTKLTASNTNIGQYFLFTIKIGNANIVKK
jgi:hypothetical protein